MQMPFCAFGGSIGSMGCYVWAEESPDLEQLPDNGCICRFFGRGGRAIGICLSSAVFFYWLNLDKPVLSLKRCGPSPSLIDGLP